MRLRHWITAILLLLLLGGTIFGLVSTQDTGIGPIGVPRAAKTAKAPKPGKKNKNAPAIPTPAPAPAEPQVEQRHLVLARQLAALAATPDEQQLARQAERLANHEVDLAFAEAIHQAVENTPPAVGEIRDLQEAKRAAEEAVTENQLRIKRLTAQIHTATGAKQDSLEDQLDVAKAQLELDQDELDEAADDLERAGGDPQAKIRRLKAAHDAAEQASHAAPPAVAAHSLLQPDSLLAKVRAWSRDRAKVDELAQARQASEAQVTLLTPQQQSLAARLKQDHEARGEAKRKAIGFHQSATTGATRQAAQETLASLKQFVENQRRLTSLVKRIQDHRELAEVYGAWGLIAEHQEQVAVHGLLRGLLTILSVLFVVFLLDRLIEHMFRAEDQEKLRASTLRGVLKFAAQLVGALVILFILIGLPSQTTTILGLAGAGLTVALKDFIVAFFGWFILMGKNGIRVGDWVEIKGVGGEVVEIGLLRTVLLETGSWSDSGHPTGRRVAFVNSFAMEGHYFNFTTSGQWMWDELTVLIQPGQDPYPVIEGIQNLLEGATAANAKLAEQEWQKATTRYRVQAFSAAPGLQVVPTSNGVEIHARYITRAFERHETRKSLYQRVVELMHGKRAEEAAEG